MSCSVPVAFFIYRRPDCTEQVFEQIRAACPSKLLVIADGPRSVDERALCEESRKVLNRVDWDCQIETLFSEVNLGCKARMVSGLTWVFQQVPEAIILEDDCLPSKEFFSFCESLLARYREEPRVALISGCNFQDGYQVGEASYYFSRYAHVWGWASWRRTWQDYDGELLSWPSSRQSLFAQLPFSDEEQSYWMNIFHLMHKGEIDTWDYQLLYSLFSHNRLSIIPNKNLISNIGFRADATHTKGKSPFAYLAREPLGDLKHPEDILPNTLADERVFSRMFATQNSGRPSLLSRLQRRLFQAKEALL